MKTPLLSVCLLTYNHVNYIRQAVESVLMQKVDFDFEFIIADDFSTDGTRDILLEYQIKYPDLIKLVLREKNYGAVNNWLKLLPVPRGKYMAYLEGDDYWFHEGKLQKQINFLENNQEYSAVHHWQKIAILNKQGVFVEKTVREKGNGYFPLEVGGAGDIFAFRMRPQLRTMVYKNVLGDSAGVIGAAFLNLI